MNCNSIKRTLPLLLLAAACGKEPALHEGPGNPDGTGITLTVSLPDASTRTGLGAKSGGKYPTLWQEGDCLQLNGFSSVPLEAADAGRGSAPFVFREGLSAPFNLLYPVSGEKDLVVFPATQNYVKDGFDPAAVPMWGTGESYTDASLRHFSSLVRISISTSAARMLKGITLTALGEEAVSGKFRAGTDENGAFDGSLSVEEGEPAVFFSFGEEGLSLGAGETAEAYIAVPKGNYSEGFKAVVQSTGYEYRILNFFSAGRNLSPGKVLEFPTRNFEDIQVIWEYFVSADGTGDGLRADTPMSVDGMVTLLGDSSSDRLNGATFHFTPGEHTISAPITLPGKDFYGSPVSYTITGDGKATLDGGGSSRIFLLTEDNSHVTIEKLTLTNGSATESGGLVCVSNTGAKFRDCTFTGTTTNTTGGAVRIDAPSSKGSGSFTDCIFSGNKAANGGALVITNAGTEGSFTRCTFTLNSATSGGGAVYAGNGTLSFTDCVFGGAEGQGNSATSTGGAIVANSSNSATVTISGGEISYNSAVNGGFLYCNKTNRFYLDGVSVHHNTAATEGGAILVPNGAFSPMFYINACSFADNTAKQNGYAIYLNTSTAGNFASLCVNNSTFYNTAKMSGSNASLVCNKGKSIILNSTLYAAVTPWGTFALGCHKNHSDEHGCLLLNSIFVNTESGKPAIYQTGANYYAEARNCISSLSSDNSQFTRTDVLSTVPVLTWDGSLFTWNGETRVPHLEKADIVDILSDIDYSLGEGFLEWLESLGALDKDQRGAARSGYIWLGSYQN